MASPRGSSSKAARGIRERGGVGEAAEGGPGRPQMSRDTRRHLNNHTNALGRARGDQSCPKLSSYQKTIFEESVVLGRFEVARSRNLL